MKTSIHFKFILFALFIFTFGCQNKTIQTENNLTQLPLQDTEYNFSTEKIQNSKSTFFFLRSFVDYFYLIAEQNQKNLPTLYSMTKHISFCAGDAHPENFGYVIQNNPTKTIFSINDMDDSGYCPIIFDLFRFMSASKIYKDDVSMNQIYDSYLSGLKENAMDTPLYLSKLKNESLKKGQLPSQKKIDNKKIKRTNSTTEVSNDIQLLIISKIKKIYPQLKLIDIVEKSKVGGGSAGLTRYELLMSDSKTNQLLILELKKQITPALYPISKANPNSSHTNQLKIDQRIKLTLNLEQGRSHSLFYNTLKLNEDEFLVRPLFSGDLGLELNDVPSEELQAVYNYEAYTLGQFHKRSLGHHSKKFISEMSQLNKNAFFTDIEKMSQFMTIKLKNLKKISDSFN